MEGEEERRAERRRGGVAHSSERPPSNSAAAATSARQTCSEGGWDWEGDVFLLLALKCLSLKKGRFHGCGLNSFVTITVTAK